MWCCNHGWTFNVGKIKVCMQVSQAFVNKINQLLQNVEKKQDSWKKSGKRKKKKHKKMHTHVFHNHVKNI